MLPNMNVKYVEFREKLTSELIGFIQTQAGSLLVDDIRRLTRDLPKLGQRFGSIPLQTYPYLLDHLEFLFLVVKGQVTGKSGYPDRRIVSEAAFALLYFERTNDLIPDAIPGMGLLDDAMIASLVLRRHEALFKHSSHAHKLRWPLPAFDIDHLLSVVSPLRLDSYYAAAKTAH